MIYLDYNSTTPIDDRVLDATCDVYQNNFGNPSSTHPRGSQARDMVNEARRSVASLVNVDPHDVVFTSGATEANNAAITGLCTTSKRVLYGATEHKSVIYPCINLKESFGVNILPIPVTQDGIIHLQKYRQLLEEEPTDFVSVMAVNSETGVINPVDEVARLARKYGAIFHCDITQAVGKIPLNLDAIGVDIATMSGHKIYGPKGIGALIASRNIRKRINPIIRGGGQENNLRSGTENVPGIVGFAKACDIAQNEGLDDMSRQMQLRNYLEEQLESLLSGTSINAKKSDRVANTTNIRIRGALADAVVVNLKRTEISTGSACSSSTMEPSHVLTAMGMSRDEADESVRISIGRPTTKDEIDDAISDLVQAVNYVRSKEELVGRVV